MKRWILALAIAIAIPVVAAHAHHSIAGMYDNAQQVTIEGIVKQFQFVNPHPFVTIEVTGESGGAEHWLLEMDNRSELVRAGINSETLKEGDRITIMGSPARRESQRLYIQRLHRSRDGFGYEQVRNSPRLLTPSR